MRIMMNNAFKNGKFKLLLLALLLAVIGLFFIYDLTPAAHTDTYNYAARQATGVTIGLIGAFLAYTIDYHFWKKIGILYVVLLFLAFLVCGVKMEILPETIKLAEGYLCLGNIRINLCEAVFLVDCLILPSIMAKGHEIMGVILLFSNMMVLRGSSNYIGWFMAMVIAVMILIIGNDQRRLLSIFLLGFFAISVAMCLMEEENVIRDYLIYDNSIIEIKDDMVYISADEPAFERSRADIVNGGIFGQGIGTSRAASGLYEDALETYIMSGIIKEVGWFGTAFILVMYLIFLFEIIKIACQTVDKVGFNLAAGIAIRFMVMFMANLLIPITFRSARHIRMPFISYGSAGVMIDIFLVGIILSVSRRNTAE